LKHALTTLKCSCNNCVAVAAAAAAAAVSGRFDLSNKNNVIRHNESLPYLTMGNNLISI